MDYRNVLDVTGSTAVITGGAGGLGFEAATALAQCGASVILADLDAEALSAALGRLKVSGAKASSVVLDVTDAQAFVQPNGHHYLRTEVYLNGYRVAAQLQDVES